jgi:hypothetical protein
MAHKNDGAILLVNRALGDGDIIGKRGGRVLYDADVVAVLFQDVVDTLPAGAMGSSGVIQLESACIQRRAPVGGSIVREPAAFDCRPAERTS